MKNYLYLKEILLNLSKNSSLQLKINSSNVNRIAHLLKAYRMIFKQSELRLTLSSVPI